MNENNDMNLAGQFLRASMLMHRYHHRGRKDAVRGGDIHRGQGRVLALLKMKPGITQKELSYLLDIRSQSMGELLAKLEKNGYITRAQSEEDKRVMNITLTEAGIKAAEQAADMQKDSDKIFDFLSDEEKEQLSGLLAKIISELQKQPGGEGMPGFDFEGREGPPSGYGFKGRWPFDKHGMKPGDVDDMRRQFSGGFGCMRGHFDDVEEN